MNLVKVISNKNKLRITIPAQEIRRIGAVSGDYIQIKIKKDQHSAEYYVQIPKLSPSRTNLQSKREIPKNVAIELGIKKGDIIEIENLRLIKNKRTARLINKDKIDILNIIPRYTKYKNRIMVDVFKKNNEDWCKVWYCSNGGGIAKCAELKRFIKIDRQLGGFFGLMQAESRKTGEKLEFTNKFISEHNLFVNIAERFGIPRSLWNCIVYHTPNLPKTEIENYKVRLLNETQINPHTISYIKHYTIERVVYAIYISSAVYSIIMLSLLIALRKYIANTIKLEGKILEFAEGFIIKELLGDGTVILRKAHTNPHIEISEQNQEVQQDIQNVLKNLEIRSSIRGIKISILIDPPTYIWLTQYGAFRGHPQNRTKLLLNVINNSQIDRLFKRICDLRTVHIKKFALAYTLTNNTAEMYLYRSMKRGYLELSDKGTYTITEKGQAFVDCIRNAKLELNELLPLNTN